MACWRSFDQSLTRIRQGRPDVTKELAWRELHVEIVNALAGMCEGAPIDKFRYPWGNQKIDLVVLIRNGWLPFENIRWQDIECNLEWLERRWPLPETAGTRPKKRRSARPKKRRGIRPEERRGTRGPAPEKTDLVANRIRGDIQAECFTMREWHIKREGRLFKGGRLFKNSRRVPQKELTKRYDCGKSTLLNALGIVWSEFSRNSDQ